MAILFPLTNISLFPPTSQTLVTAIVLSASMKLTFFDSTDKWDHTEFSFCVQFISFSIMSLGTCMLLEMARFPSFWWLNSIPFYICTTSIGVILWFLAFILLMWCTSLIGLVMLNQPYIPGINPIWSKLRLKIINEIKLKIIILGGREFHIKWGAFVKTEWWNPWKDRPENLFAKL